MKKLFTAALLLGTSLLFSACDKMQDGSVTFYVSNAGTAGKWDHIGVQIGGQSGSFFTPEKRDMSVINCDGAPNSITFNLPPGTYTYKAEGAGKWQGTVTLDNGDCRLISLRY